MNTENDWYIYFLLRLLYSIVITMSVNDGQNLWKDMLIDFQERAAFWLRKMHTRTDVADDKFQEMFLRAINNR